MLVDCWKEALALTVGDDDDEEDVAILADGLEEAVALTVDDDDDEEDVAMLVDGLEEAVALTVDDDEEEEVAVTLFSNDNNTGVLDLSVLLFCSIRNSARTANTDSKYDLVLPKALPLVRPVLPSLFFALSLKLFINQALPKFKTYSTDLRIAASIKGNFLNFSSCVSIDFNRSSNFCVQRSLYFCVPVRILTVFVVADVELVEEEEEEEDATAATTAIVSVAAPCSPLDTTV